MKQITFTNVFNLIKVYSMYQKRICDAIMLLLSLAIEKPTGR